MDIQSEKLKVIEKLLKTQDEKLIEKINSLLNEAILKPMTMEELQEKLKKSEKDIKEGRVHAHEEVVSYFKKKSE
jgi:Txe/YoeB family toxin of Txe-Axe toxin-antitoxin module